MLLDSIEWLGHSGFRIDAKGATIYIDPYRISGGPPADLILVTHGHYDHYSPQDVERIRADHTWLVAPAAVAELRRGPCGVDRAGRAGRAGAGGRGGGGGAGRLQHLQARRRGQALPPARGRLRGIRAERARRAALPRRRHRRDPRDGRGGGRGRRAAAGERHLRDDRRRGGRGRPPDSAGHGDPDALGPAHRHARGRGGVRRAGPGGGAGSWSRWPLERPWPSRIRR